MHNVSGLIDGSQTREDTASRVEDSHMHRREAAKEEGGKEFGFVGSLRR